MVKKPAFLALMLVATLAGSATSSLAAGGWVMRPAGKRPTNGNHVTQLGGSTKGLYVVGACLLDIVRVMGGSGIFEFPNLGTLYQTYGINDGPDGWDPLGVKESRPRSDVPPTPTSTPVP